MDATEPRRQDETTNCGHRGRETQDAQRRGQQEGTNTRRGMKRMQCVFEGARGTRLCFTRGTLVNQSGQRLRGDVSANGEQRDDGCEVLRSTLNGAYAAA
jgi:hypothetical protein